MGGTLLLVLVVTAGVITGKLRSGRLDGIPQAEFRLGVFLLVGIGLQTVASIAAPFSWGQEIVPVAVLLGLMALLVFAAANHRLPGMLLIGLGLLANLLVIGLNGGMPVSAETWTQAGHALGAGSQLDARHVLAGDGTMLGLLGDVFAIRPLRLTVSIGDVALYTGVFLLLQGLMIHGRYARRPRYELFDYRQLRSR